VASYVLALFDTLPYGRRSAPGGQRMDHFSAVDDFLAANYRTGLEEALCDGCLTGRLGIVLADVAMITPVLVRSEREDDGGLCATYDGTLTVQGVAYHFRCHVFVDRGGARFLSDVSEFEPVDWQARITMR
jgi:hypothetical protein